MKWIGQHIWDFISRFRSDVYLEDLDDSIEKCTLVVDGDGKVYKNCDRRNVTGTTADGVITYKDDDEIEVESTLTYNPSVTQEYFGDFEADASSGLLTIGAAGSSSSGTQGPTITTADATSGHNAKSLRLRSGASNGANKGGTPVTITGGINTGTGQPVILDVEGPNIGSAGSTPNDPVSTLKLWKAVNGTYGKSTIFSIFDPGGTDLTLNKLSFYVSDDADNCVIQARKHSGDAKLTLDVDGDIDINADGGSINFKDGATDIGNLTSGDGLELYSNTSGIKPELQLESHYNSFQSPGITLWNRRSSDSSVAGVNEDMCGYIKMTGMDAVSAPFTAGSITTYTQDITNGQEKGRMELKVANKIAMNPGLILTGTATTGAVDATVGYGAASTVTIPGNLTVSGTTTTINTTDLNVEDKNIT